MKLRVIAAGLMLGVSAFGAPIVLRGDLSGPAEAPPNASPGTGLAIVTIDAATHEMRVEVSFSGLIGTVTAAHIHCCVTAPGTVGVATSTPTFPGFPSGVTSGSYDVTFDMTQAASFSSAFINNNGGSPASAEAALFAGL